MLEQHNDILTAEELCEILMIGKNAVYTLLASGEIKSFRNGSRWRIPKQAVVDYIKGQSGLDYFFISGLWYY